MVQAYVCLMDKDDENTCACRSAKFKITCVRRTGCNEEERKGDDENTYTRR